MGSEMCIRDRLRTLDFKPWGNSLEIIEQALGIIRRRWIESLPRDCFEGDIQLQSHEHGCKHTQVYAPAKVASQLRTCV